MVNYLFNTYFLIERQLICFFPPQEQTDQYRRPSKLGSNEDIFASACDDGVLRLFDISQSISGTTLVFFLLKSLIKPLKNLNMIIQKL